MAIKVGNKMVGESAEEQYDLEKKRFYARQKRKTCKIKMVEEKPQKYNQKRYLGDIY